jgi:hypothetical protein
VAVELALFRDGVGCLTIRAEPASQEVADWLDFLHYFRFARGQRGVGLRAERRVGAPLWWEEIFSPGQLLPFTAFFVEAAPAEEVPLLLYRVRKRVVARRDDVPPPFQGSI